MEKELNYVAWDKYLGTDIDSLVFFFNQDYKEDVVDLFDVPSNEEHMVFLCLNKDDGDIRWIEIVDPQTIVGHPNATLPDIVIRVGDERVTFYDLICYILEQDKEQNK